eukprot:TRINITY_DN779806_c0_g1_i1.p1 TRINITY_DN779806_c0_g1~~TRINITY_DN779806_c0_g1_i1.p1  ORF type:complete len:252 (+),score=63.78 TRINITY_DN779806_c0_g1_i1:42-797(+)
MPFSHIVNSLPSTGSLEISSAGPVENGDQFQHLIDELAGCRLEHQHTSHQNIMIPAQAFQYGSQFYPASPSLVPNFPATPAPQMTISHGQRYQSFHPQQTALVIAGQPEIVESDFNCYYCTLCDLECTSKARLYNHLRSKRHSKRRSTMLIRGNGNNAVASPPSNPSNGLNVFDRIRRGSDSSTASEQKEVFECQICDLTCTSKAQLDEHLLGKKHKLCVKAAKHAEAKRLQRQQQQQTQFVLSTQSTQLQ